MNTAPCTSATRRRRTQRLSALIMVCLTLLCASAANSGKPGPLGKPPAKPMASFGTTVVVFPATTYLSDGSNTWVADNGYFTVASDSIHGYRYSVEVVNGSPAANGATISVNGHQFIGTSDFSLSTTTLTRVIDVAAGTNNLGVGVKGTSASAGITVRVLRAPELTFSSFGRKTYVRPATIAAQVDTIPVFADGVTPYMLWALNGDTTGTGHRMTSATVSINNTQVMSSSDFGTGKAMASKTISLNQGATNTLSLLNSSASGTQVRLWVTATGSRKPQVSIVSPATDTFYTAASQTLISANVTDHLWGWTRVNALASHPTPGGAVGDLVTHSTDGIYRDSVYAINSAGLDTTVYRTIYRDTQPPTLTLTAPDTGVTVTDDHIHFTGTWSDLSKTQIMVDGDPVGRATTSGSFDTTVVLDVGPNAIIVRATDAAGNASQIKRVVFRSTPNDNPPAAPSVPGIASTSFTPFLPSVAFLYRTGSQTVPDSTVFDSAAARASVIRGRTTGRDYGPIGNVKVQVLGHPEFGSTISRADGQFDLVVLGGGPLTLRFDKAGYFEAQRTLTPVVNDYATLDDVAMIGGSAKAVTVSNASTGIARSRFASDANGDRDLRMIFPQGTVATTTTAGGTTHSYSTMTVRAKEFTVGPDGPKTMPAPLPPSSAYTYCVDLRLDEADAQGHGGDTLVTTQFSKPVACYVKNFLHMPVGTSVPLGYYDPSVAQWKGANDGIIVKILGFSATGDTARLDSRDTGTADDSTRLAQLGITGEELVHLKSQYAAGDTVVRIMVDHFSFWDINYNLSSVLAAMGRAFGRVLKQIKQLTKPCTVNGSIIECENRILGERFGIPGTPYSLNYRSARAPGDLAIRTLTIPVIGSTVPQGLQRIHVTLDVAGRHYIHLLNGPFTTATPPDTITWDGLDAYGRRVQGSVNGTAGIGYDFETGYSTTTSSTKPSASSFGNPVATFAPLGPAKGDRAVSRITWSHQRVSLGAPGTDADGLGGWTLSSHHVYDPNGNGAVYLGDGSVMFGDEFPPTIQRVTSTLVSTDYVCLAPDGSLYATDGNTARLIHISRAGDIQVLAGTGQGEEYSGDGPGTATKLPGGFTGLALAADGSLYFTCNVGLYPSRAMVGKWTPDGMVKKLIGAGPDTHTGTGDGGPITSATVATPMGIAVGPDGSVFFGEADDHVVRRISTTGIVTRYAGTGSYYEPDADQDSSGGATQIRLNGVYSVHADDQGNVYVCEHSRGRIRQVSPDGLVSTWASGGVDFAPYAMDFAPDGSAYISSAVDGNSSASHRVWRRDPDGTLSSIAGGGLAEDNGTPAAAASLFNPRGIAVAPDGSYYLGHRYIHRISRTLGTASATEIAIPSRDGSEIFYFSTSPDSYGQHIRTRDALTGAVRFRFRYDGAGRLLTVTDVAGLTTTIQRDTGHLPIAVLGPFGHRTRLDLDGNLHLSAITDTLNRTLAFETHSDGLLWKFTDAMQNDHQFTYAADGRLSTDAEPASTGGSQTFTHTTSGITRTVQRATAEGRYTTYTLSDSSNGARRRDVAGPDGLHAVSVGGPDPKSVTQLPDGSISTDVESPDTRFGVTVPVPQKSTFRTPAGKTLVVETSRSWTGTFASPLVASSWSQDVKINGRTPFHSEFNLHYPDSLTWRSQSPMGRVAVATLDTAGRIVTSSVPGLATSTYFYNAQGRLQRLQVGSERAWAYTYDARGRLATVTDTLGRLDSLRYDDGDRVIGTVRPDGQVVAFGFDKNNDLLSVTPPGRAAYTFGFDANGATKSYLPPVVGGQPDSVLYTYNRDAQPEHVARPGEPLRDLTYESGTGRLLNVALARGDLHYAFTATGQVDSVRSPDGVSLAFGYDGSIPISERWVGPVAGTVEVQIDDDLRPIAQSVNGGSSIALGYDPDGLLTGAGIESLHHLSSNGMLDSTSLSNLNATSSQGYNAYGELAYRHYGWTGGGYLQCLEQDPVGRIQSMYEYVTGDSTHLDTYAYTTAGRLESVTRDGNVLEHYEYDANGNRTLASGARIGTPVSPVYDAQDRLTQYGSAHYGYTRSGELSYKAVGTDTTRYTYDELGNLITVVFPDHHQIDYLIDGRGRRVGKQVDGVLVAGWLYQNGLNVVAELDGTGAVTTRYVYGSRGTVPDYMERGGVTYRIVTDALGSVRMVVNASNGTVVERLDYDSFGRVLSVVGTPGFIGLGFAGGLTDAATGLVRFGRRDYDPVVGRWTARDPIRFAGGSSNLMAYAGSDPVNLVDPTGTTICSNVRFLLKWIVGTLPDRINYNAHARETAEMQRSPGAALMRTAFEDAGYETVKVDYDSPEAWWQTLVDPRTADWSSTSAQVGGFAGASVTNNGDGTATYRIENTAGTHSFIYHAVPDSPLSDGPMHNVKQRFEWTEPIPGGGK